MVIDPKSLNKLSEDISDIASVTTSILGDITLGQSFLGLSKRELFEGLEAGLSPSEIRTLPQGVGKNRDEEQEINVTEDMDRKMFLQGIGGGKDK